MNDSVFNKKNKHILQFCWTWLMGLIYNGVVKKDSRILVFWELDFANRLFICTHSYAIRYMCVSVGIREINELGRCDDMGSGL